MSGMFNGKILVDKLEKLNSSQQSIETLSHWCIFHRAKAKQVVETWDQQFHLSSQDQRVPYLYLANDILQNSRRKGLEFVVEFRRVLPDAINDVIENGDEYGRKSARRLVDIWEERKVFNSNGHDLKEEFLGRKQKNHSSISRSKLMELSGHGLEKLKSGFEHVYAGSLNEEVVLSTCQNAINCVQKWEEARNDPGSGSSSKSGITQDLQAQNVILKDCIEQLKVNESSRAILVSYLKENLQDQEFKLHQVRDKLQAAQASSELTRNVYEQLNTEQKQKEATLFLGMPRTSPESQHISGEKENSTTMIYNQQGPVLGNPTRTADGNLKSTAAAMAAKLAASTSSAEMLSSLLSTLASEGVIGKQNRENHSADNAKRIKLENGMPSYMSTHHQQLPPPQFSQPELLMKMMPPPQQQQSLSQQPSTLMLHPATSMLPLERPMSLPPLQAPLHPNQLTQAAGPTVSAPYSFGSTTTLPPVYTTSGTPSYSVPSSSYQNIHVTEEGGPSYSVPSSSYQNIHVTEEGGPSYSVPPNSYQNIQVTEEGGPFLGQPQPPSSISH